MPTYVWPAAEWGFKWLSGGGYWQTLTTIKIVQTAALCLNVLYIEDLYITGYLRKHLGINLFEAHGLRPLEMKPIDTNWHMLYNLVPTALRDAWNNTVKFA